MNHAQQILLVRWCIYSRNLLNNFQIAFLRHSLNFCTMFELSFLFFGYVFTNIWNSAELNIQYSFSYICRTQLKCPSDKILHQVINDFMIRHTHTHTHSCTTGVCAHSPCPEGLSPAVTHVIPPHPWRCEDEGIDGGGGVRVVSSYQHQGQLCKKKKKTPLVVHRSLCSV